MIQLNEKSPLVNKNRIQNDINNKKSIETFDYSDSMSSASSPSSFLSLSSLPPKIILDDIYNNKEIKIASKWNLWKPTSPSHRFFLLFCLCFIPFGGHFVKNGMSSLEPFMLQDKKLKLTNTMYGALNSAVSIPNMIIPFMGGKLLDIRGHISILAFLSIATIGQIIFAIGMNLKLYWYSIIGRIIFGLGEGSVVVGTRVIVSRWFEYWELTFAMGMTVAISNVSKMIAKATVAPIAIYFNNYVYALWYGAIICLFSLCIGGFVCYLTKNLKKLIKQYTKYSINNTNIHSPKVPDSLKWLQMYSILRNRRRKKIKEEKYINQQKKFNLTDLKSFSCLFWLLAFLHVVFINVFHLFQNVSSSYLYETYGYSVVKAGIISSFSHSLVILAPFIGLMIDHVGGRIYLIGFSACLSILAYILLIFFPIVPPIISMLIMSFCLSFTPTILMASIPFTIHKNWFGAAFGIVEVMDAIGGFCGNIIIGLLRDMTGDYMFDMFFLLGLACFSLILCILLIYEDHRKGAILRNATKKSRHNSFLHTEESIQTNSNLNPILCNNNNVNHINIDMNIINENCLSSGNEEIDDTNILYVSNT